MSTITWHSPDALRNERRALLATVDLDEAALRRLAAEWSLSNREADVLSRLEQIDFLLGDDD